MLFDTFEDDSLLLRHGGLRMVSSTCHASRFKHSWTEMFRSLARYHLPLSCTKIAEDPFLLCRDTPLESELRVVFKSAYDGPAPGGKHGQGPVERRHRETT